MIKHSIKAIKVIGVMCIILGTVLFCMSILPVIAGIFVFYCSVKLFMYALNLIIGD